MLNDVVKNLDDKRIAIIIEILSKNKTLNKVLKSLFINDGNDVASYINNTDGEDMSLKNALIEFENNDIPNDFKESDLITKDDNVFCKYIVDNCVDKVIILKRSFRANKLIEEEFCFWLYGIGNDYKVEDLDQNSLFSYSILELSKKQVVKIKREFAKIACKYSLIFIDV